MINTCKDMTKELDDRSNKIRAEILEREITLIIQAINAQEDLNKIRDELSKQLVEVRGFASNY